MKINIMLFLATVALLAVGAEISARSSSRESVRPPCPAGMIRAGNAVRTGYSADKVHGVHAGENMPDSALGMLRRFYEEYIAAWLRNGDNEEGLAILRRYLVAADVCGNGAGLRSVPGGAGLR